MSPRILPAACASLLLLSLAPAGDARAEVQDCMVISSLPATLTSQGLYCLKSDLATALASGAAITVANNNVIIDCNDFKLGGLSAGSGTRTVGIRADARNNVVVRNCNIRGFFQGIYFADGAGHVIESNRLDGNTFLAAGFFAVDGATLRNNLITDTGGNTPVDVSPMGTAYGIGAQNSTGILVEGNTLNGTAGTPGATTGSATAIAMLTASGTVRGNSVHGVVAGGVDGTAIGIGATTSPGSAIVDNVVLATGADAGITATSASVCARNTLIGVASLIGSCTDGGGNAGTLP